MTRLTEIAYCCVCKALMRDRAGRVIRYALDVQIVFTCPECVWWRIEAARTLDALGS